MEQIVTSDYSINASRYVVKKGSPITFQQVLIKHGLKGLIVASLGAQNELLNGVNTAVKVYTVSVEKLSTQEQAKAKADAEAKAKADAEAKAKADAEAAAKAKAAAASAPPPLNK